MAFSSVTATFGIELQAEQQMMRDYSADDLLNFYNNEPQDVRSDELSQDYWQTLTISRPLHLPLKTTLSRNTNTANSSKSDLRTLHQCASAYLHEQNHQSDESNETQRMHHFKIFPELNTTGTRNSVKQVDYRVPDSSRPLEVRIGNRSLYIDPNAAKEISPQISAFLLREYAAGNESSVEPKVGDLRYEEVLEAVRAVCPTELGLFATPVTASTFSSLARMSCVFQVQKLKQACELYIARVPLRLNELSAAFAASMLSDSFKYAMNSKSKVRLLQGVIGLIEAEIQDPIIMPSYCHRSPCVLPVIASLIDATMQEYKQGRLSHDKMLNEARLKIPCRTCRVENSSASMQMEFGKLQVCRRCRQTTCHRCLRRPCASLIEEFMEKFAKDYEEM